MPKILIVMGSKTDLDYANKIEAICRDFEIPTEKRIASGHKTPKKVLSIINEYKNKDVVFITIAGRSNALSGLLDANTDKPVISSPPYSDKFGGADIFSSLRMPSGVAPMVVLGAEQSALAAVKILGLHDKKIREKITEYQKKYKEEIELRDKEISSG